MYDAPSRAWLVKMFRPAFGQRRLKARKRLQTHALHAAQLLCLVTGVTGLRLRLPPSFRPRIRFPTNSFSFSHSLSHPSHPTPSLPSFSQSLSLPLPPARPVLLSPRATLPMHSQSPAGAELSTQHGRKHMPAASLCFFALSSFKALD